MTLTLGILTRNPNSWASKELQRACIQEGISYIFFKFSDVTAKICGPYDVKAYIRGVDIRSLTDVVLVRPIGKCSLEQAIFRIDFLHLLKELGIRVINDPRSIEIAIDKFRTLYMLALRGFKTPLTIVMENEYRIFDSSCADIFNKRDIVIKPLFGSRGFGIVRLRCIKDVEDLIWRIGFYLTSLGAVVYIQEYLRKRGVDYRLFVIGDRVVASMIRRAPPGQWKTNISRGGRPVPVKVSENLADVAIRACEVIGCEIAGVDVVELEGEYYILELNTQPGWRGIQEATGVDIAREIVKYIKESVKK